MVLALTAIVVGIIILVASADKFVTGASALAVHLGLPPLLIGMVIVGFGTSAPELSVSLLAAIDGSPGLALGNAYGSNIANIALILGVTALFSPITVASSVLKKELPILTAVTLCSYFFLDDLVISRIDALILLLLFTLIMAWTIIQSKKNSQDLLAQEFEQEQKSAVMTIRRSVVILLAGLIFLIASSRILVWGAVELARRFGVSDLIIGLTVVAVGTSLPELASAIAAAKKHEHDIALGNVIGSNMFNTLAVVGGAGIITPISVEALTRSRDMIVMGVLTVSLFVIGYGFKKERPGRINRIEAAFLLIIYAGYTGMVIRSAVA
jgi:cation:H+ antiporter